MTLVYQVLIPSAAALILFSLGLVTDLLSILRLARRPVPLVVGLLARWVLVPALAVGVCLALRTSPTTSLGLLVVAACPLATPTAAVARVGHGDTALALMLTAVTNLACAVSLPLLLVGGAHLVGVQAAAGLPDLGPTAASVGLVATVPTLVGMAVRWVRPSFAARVEPRVTPFVLVLLGVLVGTVVYTSWSSIHPSLAEAGGAALVLNILVTALAWALGRLAGLSRPERVTVALASGLYNFGLAAFVSLAVIRDARVVLPAIAYGLLMWGSAALLVAIGRRPPRSPVPARWTAAPR